jgi:glucokinase
MPEAATQEELVIGVDIGGTKVAAGLVDRKGEIRCQTRTPMVSDRGAANGLRAVMAAIEAVLAESVRTTGAQPRIGGVGLCSPGPLDPKSGVVINPPNLPCWRNFPLAAEVARVYRLPIEVDNDANAAGLAEALWGARRGYHNVFYVTVGTGIGTAIVLDGRIFHGRTGAAGEGGHVSIDYRGPKCKCGKPGCIEIFASGPAIAERARAKIEGGRRSSILDLAGGSPERVNSELVGQAHAAGDAVADEVLRETVELFSFWLGNIIDLLEPDVVILGGGVSSLLKPFLSDIRDRLPACCVNQRCQETPLVLARYGEDAGIAGGAALCFATTRGEAGGL